MTRGPNLLVVIARPSHGGWVEDVIDVLHPTSELLYITVPRNRRIDIPHQYDVTRVARRAGLDYENVFHVHHAEAQCRRMAS